MTPAVKAIIFANIALFVLSLFCARSIIAYLGLIPQAVIERGWIWQLGDLHVPARRSDAHPVQHARACGCSASSSSGCGARSSSPASTRSPAIGAGIDRDRGLVRCRSARCSATYGAVTIGASGALYGLSAGLRDVLPGPSDPDVLLFPVPAKYFVMIIRRACLPDRARQPGLERRPPRRPALVGYLYLQEPARRRRRSHRRNQVPLSEMEDEPPPPQVRRLLRRKVRLGQARALRTQNSRTQNSELLNRDGT